MSDGKVVPMTPPKVAPIVRPIAEVTVRLMPGNKVDVNAGDLGPAASFKLLQQGQMALFLQVGEAAGQALAELEALKGAATEKAP